MDKMVMAKKGVCLVMFFTMDSRDRVCARHYFFDSKPLIFVTMECEYGYGEGGGESCSHWIQLKLNFKYWGKKSPFKIARQLRKPIERDYATTCRYKIQFARVMVEVPMNYSLLGHISFTDEHGELITVGMHYEWRPTMCGK